MVKEANKVVVKAVVTVVVMSHFLQAAVATVVVMSLYLQAAATGRINSVDSSYLQHAWLAKN